ncbi:MAG TPA: DUF6351 family protein, partial [Burkholderiaceae bacterium]|nr:DUF6351 family protein [Burkholderiaceae bacterium]
PQHTAVGAQEPPQTSAAGPVFTAPRQQPFVCTTTDFGLQPKIDASAPPGFEVRDAAGRTIGYSRDCTLDPFVTYWYRSVDGRWLELPADGTRPSDVATATTLDGRSVDFVVRQERGTINRFLYSLAMLAPANEDPAQPDTSLWNRRLVYYFHGGVGIGHSQGRYRAEAMDATLLAQGYAIAFSSGTSTATHHNTPLAAETATMTKARFVERYGMPLYTVGLGGSGGAIQQYFLAQNHPDLLDALVTVQSYPDMVTQTIHVGDCELLEHYMDVTDRGNARWWKARDRMRLVGYNADDNLPQLLDPLAPVKLAHGYSAPAGTTTCSRSWRGLTPLVMNPHFGRLHNEHLMQPPESIAQLHRTHYDDLRAIYGVDETGQPRTTWDNVGVQYGLLSLKQGLISPAEFIDLNFRVGGWKHPRDMVQEGSPLLGLLEERPISEIVAEALLHRSRFDPWSRRNMLLAAAPDLPAPRTAGDLAAMRAAYASGLVFDGELPLPTIDLRHYLDRELDMHDARQSFVVRERVLQRMGHSDHLAIWFTDARPGATRHEQWHDALAAIDAWLANMRRDPQRSIGANRPAVAADSCFDATGQLQYAGPDAWAGLLEPAPLGPCAARYPLHATPRIIAGAPTHGAMFKCALKPVIAAIADGTYAPWTPNVFEIARLQQAFPQGVCDYARPDLARP